VDLDYPGLLNPIGRGPGVYRAHHMGQKRSVTICRLVAKDTIEDKIVALHQHKRDVTEGDISGKMSIKAMLDLLQVFD